MNVPVIRGTIERRILLNYHIDPDVMARLLPAPFRPLVHNGYGIGGICMIRLKGIRPRGLPAMMGLSSENAAHRFSVMWDEGGETQTGVYVPRRDTNSVLNAFAGGRVFPGIHHRSRFDVNESDDRLRVAVTPQDGKAAIEIVARPDDAFPDDSIFDSLEAASDFFKAEAEGYSATPDDGRFDGLELRTMDWSVRPMRVETVRSGFFEDPDRFPEGSIAFDCALLMTEIEHEWHALADVTCPVCDASA